MKKLIIIILLAFVSGITDAQASDPIEGYAIVRSDTIYGKIQINFDAGSIVIQQDSVNRMYLSGITQVTLINKTRETFIPFSTDDNTTFYKILVDGEYPLLEDGELFFTLADEKNEIIQISEEGDLYDFFGKKHVKEYIFMRNINLSDRTGIVDVFNYFSKNNSY